jgi:hypothetical protein
MPWRKTILYLMSFCLCLTISCTESHWQTPTSPQEPIYPGSSGNCRYLPLNIDNHWSYLSSITNNEYDSYGYLVSSESRHGSLLINVPQEPTDPDVNNYWELHFQYDPLTTPTEYSSTVICQNNGAYEVNDMDMRLIIRDEMSIGDETDIGLIFGDGPCHYTSLIDRVEVPAGVFNNVRLLEHHYYLDEEGCEGDHYIENDYYEYYAINVGLIKGVYYQANWQQFHEKYETYSTYVLSEYNVVK